MKTWVDEDTTQNDMPTILQDLSSKSQGSRVGEGRKRKTERGKGRQRQEKEDRKKVKRGNNNNIELRLSNFRYHRNWFRDFSTKLQINAAKSTCGQTSSDKEPFNYILKIILNKKSNTWNTNELLDAISNEGSSESNSARLVNTFCLIENID